MISWRQRLFGRIIFIFSSATARKGVITLADQGIVSMTNFLTSVIIGRACAKEHFGLYWLGFSIVLFIANIQDSLISKPYVIYSSRLEGSAHTKYASSSLIHQVALSALAILGLVAGGVVLSFGIGPQGLAPVVWALVVVITFILLQKYAREVCFAHLRMKTALVLDSCVFIFQIGGLLLLAYIDFLSASCAYLVIGTACGIAALGWLLYTYRTFSLSHTQVISDLRRNWSLGKWILAGSLTFSMSRQLYPFFLAGFNGTSATGVLAACYRVVFLANPFIIAMNNFLGPKISHAYAMGGGKKIGSIVFIATSMLALVVGLLCLAIIIFGGQLVVLIYGSKYAGNGTVVSILALSILASAIASPTAYGLLALERSKVHFKVSFVALGVTLTLGLWLVKSFGLLGAAYGILANSFVVLGINLITFSALVRRDSVLSSNRG